VKSQVLHLTSEDRLGDLVRHPAFAGFGELMLPWDDRGYDAAMPLDEIASLLPYHSNVNVPVVVNAINHLIDDSAGGQRVFLDFYTTARKQSAPGKRRTGLFFFRGRPDAPFALIASGGGFEYVASVHEGFPYASRISALGFNAFVLKYRLDRGAIGATQDMAAALTYIFRNAGELGVGTEDYSLWGSSAGARMAAAIGSYGSAEFAGDNLPKPSAVVMAYTGHSDYAGDEPRTFVVGGERDAIAPVAVMESRVTALRKAGTEVAFFRYRDVGHGFGPGVGTTAEGWLDEAVCFWRGPQQIGPHMCGIRGQVSDHNAATR
jgi:acetyl esterase/lipase